MYAWLLNSLALPTPYMDLATLRTRQAECIHYQHAHLMATLWPHAQVGGVQLPDDAGYSPPRYSRYYPPKNLELEMLDTWGDRAAAWQWSRLHMAQKGSSREQQSPQEQPKGQQQGAVMTVDVLVPCGRAVVEDVAAIVEKVVG